LRDGSAHATIALAGMWKVTIEDPDGCRVDVLLKYNEYLFGRGPENKVRLTERNISRQHARIVRHGPGFVLEDLGSLNGTYVNAQAVVAPVALQHADHIQMGDYRLVVFQDATEPTQAPSSHDIATAWLSGLPPRLVMLAGPTPAAEFPLSRPRMIIGRGDGVDILIDHQAVSRRHCEVVALEEGRFEVVDLGSANGLLVNGQELRRAILDAGDVLMLGDEVALKFVPAGDILRPAPMDRPALPPARPTPAATHLLPLLVLLAVLVVFRSSIAALSRDLSLIEVEDAAEALSALDTAGAGRSARLRQGDDVADTLMVPFVVVVLDVLGQDMTQVALAERDHVAKAFLTDGSHEAFRERVEE
jgi:pSer/pThr/pTyr-binding forkhead associated (FHA) protein